jgi:hypothetical protein
MTKAAMVRIQAAGTQYRREWRSLLTSSLPRSFLRPSFLERDERDQVLLGKAFGGGYEAVGQGTHEGRGSNGLSAMAVKKLHHSAFVL